MPSMSPPDVAYWKDPIKIETACRGQDRLFHPGCPRG